MRDYNSPSPVEYEVMDAVFEARAQAGLPSLSSDEKYELLKFTHIALGAEITQHWISDEFDLALIGETLGILQEKAHRIFESSRDLWLYQMAYSIRNHHGFGVTFDSRVLYTHTMLLIPLATDAFGGDGLVRRLRDVVAALGHAEVRDLLVRDDVQLSDVSAFVRSGVDSSLLHAALGE